MKKELFVSINIVLLFIMTGCGQRDKSAILAQYKYENSDTLSVNLSYKLEPWIKEGADCYCLVMVCDKLLETPLRIKEVHSKIVKLHDNGIQMKSLEDVKINRVTECTKITFAKGEPVIMLIAPENAFGPNTRAAGPSRISIRWMFFKLTGRSKE